MCALVGKCCVLGLHNHKTNRLEVIVENFVKLTLFAFVKIQINI